MPLNPNEQQLDIIFHYGAYPLWKFIIQKFEIDIRDVCTKVATVEPKLVANQHTYIVDVVDNDYDNELNESMDHNENITFLLNCVNVVFNTLKEGIVRNGIHILKPYYFQLDERRNLELILVETPEESEYIYSINDNIKLGIRLETQS
jgi:hypothetical protein